MPFDEKWLTEWFYRLDQASRANAITELRGDQEKAVVEINRQLTDNIKIFSRLILELWALKDAEGAIDPREFDRMFTEAKALEEQTRDLEDQLETARKKFAAFEEMERLVNRMR